MFISSIDGYVQFAEYKTVTPTSGEPFKTAKLIVSYKGQTYKGKSPEGKAIYEDKYFSHVLQATGKNAEYLEKYCEKGSYVIAQCTYEWEQTKQEEKVTNLDTSAETIRKVEYHRFSVQEIKVVKTDAPDGIARKKIALTELKTAINGGWKGYTVEQFIEALAAQILEMETPTSKTPAPATPTN